MKYNKDLFLWGQPSITVFINLYY